MFLVTDDIDDITAGTSRLARSYTGWLKETRSDIYPAMKRATDVLMAGMGLVLLSPLFLVVAILVRLDSPGPIFFSQIRVGRRGRPFSCYKFRSMSINAEKCQATLSEFNEMQGGTTFKMKHDPRITRLGRYLRKASIDELPQLWNVLVGDMSLVGPRPPVPGEVAQYSALDRKRLSVKPGITCIWQVNGRSDIPFAQQVELDLRYINERSLLLDIKLLLLTVPAVLLARGAY